MKDETYKLIKDWFHSKTGITLMHDPALVSLVNEIVALRTPDAAGQSEGLCRHNNIGAANGNKMYCKDCKKWVDNE